MRAPSVWKVWLKRNLLTRDVENDFIAEVSTAENTLRNEDIAARVVAARSELRLETIASILAMRDEMGYFSIHPNVGGTFDKVNEAHDAKKHPVTFRFRARAPLRALAERIVVEVEGLSDVTGYIDKFVDVSTESMNYALTPGGQFSVAGHKTESLAFLS
ncbi:MAG: hypothetical protein LBL45_03890 [Treponema sp.]|nr:hypothetical protein [Treponema sp.]